MQEMLRSLALFVMSYAALIGHAVPGGADAPSAIAPRPLSSALEALQGGRWERAQDLAARDGPVALTLVEWYRLRAGRGSVDEVLTFLAAHPDWPGLERLRAQSIDAFHDATDAQILALYKGAAPETGTGVLRHAAALIATGQVGEGEGEANVVKAWLTFDLSTEEHVAFLNAHGPLLAPYHDTRMRMTLWRGLKDSALMLPLVSDEMRAIADIRLMAQDGRRGLEAQIAKLPQALRDDPGLAYDRFNSYIKQDKPEQAMELMQSQSRIEGGLGEAWRWAGWRRDFARRMMRGGNYERAYDLASHHQLVDGAAYADLEWLSGYLALRHLGDAELARDHFQRLRAAVETPISLGRAGYWIGRAQEALGDIEAAQIAYAEGAEHQTSFYGLLAAERANLPFDASLAGGEVFAPWREAAFVQKPLFKAAALLLRAGQLNLSEMFFMALADTLERSELGQLGAALEALEQPHLQVMLGKRAAQRGILLPRYYYALHPMTQLELPVPMELALAIARRESEFDFRVASGAGAQGLMQLMPGTASDVARDLGLEHDRARVLTDWQYNALLGSTYLAQLSRQFGGNVVMMSAGYNAGPRRPLRWMKEYGDPREMASGGQLDMVDWIETLPFDETRNYVQRVAESLPIYRARLGNPAHPIPFSEELKGMTITVK
ncbi:lytic transglycosylase domain-containing protein [Rhodobacteraceae bacterium KMM 6894]|nr:lytic transglycosylase domain-containing protein [Rhodobacteraceae bacterium KMM 6894]